MSTFSLDSEKEKIVFADTFLDEYMKRGFGSMNKTDLETLLFHALRKAKEGPVLFSNYDWSLQLRVPEAKVKKWNYEADLRYIDVDPQRLKKEFFYLLANSDKFVVDERRVQFAVENRCLREMLAADLKKLGYFADGSFKSEVMSLSLAGFSDLVFHYFPEEQKEELDKLAKQYSSKENKKKFINGSKLLEIGLKEAVKAIGNKIPDFLGDITTCFFGGNSLAQLLVNLIK